MAYPFEFEGIINDTKELEILNKLFFQTYNKKYRWEKLFSFGDPSKLTLMWRRIHPTIYTTSTGATIFNGMGKDLTYTSVTFQEEVMKLDSQFTFARTMSPTEKKFIMGLLKNDIKQGITAELNFRRQIIMKKLQEPNAVYQLQMTTYTDQDSFLTAYDNLTQECDKIGLTVKNLLCSVKFFNDAKKYLKLQVYSDKQVNEFVDSPYASDMITDVQGIRLWKVVKEFEYNAPDGTIQLLKLMNDNTTVIAMEDGPTEEWIALRAETHTPLRSDTGKVGTGKGATIFTEWIRNYGAGIKEPKKFLIGEIAIQKKSLSDAMSQLRILLNEPIVLDDFKNAVVRTLSTNQGMWNIKLTDLDFFQSDGTTPLVVGDLSFGTVTIVVKASAGSTLYQDSKTLYVDIEKGQ